MQDDVKQKERKYCSKRQTPYSSCLNDAVVSLLCVGSTVTVVETEKVVAQDHGPREEHSLT